MPSYIAEWVVSPIKMGRWVTPHPPERVDRQRAIVLQMGRASASLFAQDESGRALLEGNVLYQTIPPRNWAEAVIEKSNAIAAMLGVPLLVEST